MSALDRLAELQAAVVEAQSAEREVKAQAQAVQAQIVALERQLTTLPSDQFDAAQQPKPKTEAAKLATDLTQLKHPPVSWNQRTAAARKRVEEAKRGVVRHRARHGEELILMRETEAIAKRDAVLAKVDELRSALRDFATFEAEIGNLLNLIAGMDHHDLPSITSVDELQKALRRFTGDLPIPLPRSMFAQEGQQQPRVRTANGWISRANAESSAIQERNRAEDPERKAQRARRSPAAVR